MIFKDITLGSSIHAFVAVVDDDHALRELICETLQSLSIRVIGFPDAQSFLAYASWRHCSCLVLDVRLPGISGTELQRRLKVEGATTPIIFITTQSYVPLAVEAMQQGALDYLLKPLDWQKLVDRVQLCLRDADERRGSESRRAAIEARLACLTPREREVFDLVMTGQRSKQMAASLGISLKTVEDYRSNVLRKMHVSSTPELMSVMASAHLKTTLDSSSR
jgi:two-component system, LuxR family, response regulator DctR